MDDVIETIEGCHISGEELTDIGTNNPCGDAGSDEDGVQLPSILIVTGVPDVVFDTEEGRTQFESVFSEFEPETVQFHYLRSFRRVRVVYKSSESATAARIHINERDIHGTTIKCFFAQPLEEEFNVQSVPFLQPPRPDKQFLISPPCSPPVGWEPCDEQQPVLNFDLLSAITNLAPGETHELHAGSDSMPGIVVHVCEDPEGFKTRPAILQTRRPFPA